MVHLNYPDNSIAWLIPTNTSGNTGLSSRTLLCRNRLTQVPRASALTARDQASRPPSVVRSGWGRGLVPGSLLRVPGESGHPTLDGLTNRGLCAANLPAEQAPKVIDHLLKKRRWRPRRHSVLHRRAVWRREVVCGRIAKW
jgi:hypothetical protein